ncbi:uroporphyrinogen decarboxylase family protein [Fontivita pretiosa]|uniref:uroporphyrinogen decarboxylase family protein n=1 Tax=Fontivita pretiosa TaxID=2989684 RepID=UPI003D162B61
MIGRPTDHRNLDLTQLHLDVCFGRAGGKIIWQPRILSWYDDKLELGQPLPPPYTGMTRPQLYRALGCSHRIYEFNACIVPHEDPRVRVTRQQLNETDFQILYETPVGSQLAVYRRQRGIRWNEPLKWPITSPQEMKVAAWRALHRTWSFDRAKYDELCATWQGIGAPTVYILRTTVQQLFVADMGVEAATYALLDYPEVCEEYFEALNVTQQRQIEVINHSPIQIVNFGDNIHASTLPPQWFEKYILPVYQRRCELLHKAGKFVHAHWDGNCKPLLRYARQTGLDGIEAITPLPQGDVTLEEVRQALGDMFLLDGIPAVYFETTFSEQTLIDCAKRCIELFAPRLILGISDEMAADGEIERIRLVGQVVDDYNASL